MEYRILNINFLKERKIAVIDTGIDIKYREFLNKKIEIVEFKNKDKNCNHNGHGTSCCGEILNFNPKASLVVIPILNENCMCSLDALYQALVYCNNRDDIGIINLSLACIINDPEINYVFQELIDEISKKDKMIIASNKNKVSDPINVYPYKFNNVLGVTKSCQVNPFIIYNRKLNRCKMYYDSYFMPDINGNYKVFYGNSSLTAKLTGLISSQINSIKINQLPLYNIIQMCNDKLEKIYISENLYNLNIELDEIENIKYKTKKLWVDFCNERDKATNEDLRLNRTFNNTYGGNFLKLIENEIGFKFDYRKFTTTDLNSLTVIAKKCLYSKL